MLDRLTACVFCLVVISRGVISWADASAPSEAREGPGSAPVWMLPAYPRSARCAALPFGARSTTFANATSTLPRVAVGFFGLAYRNLAHTLPSLESHLFAPLDAAPLTYEVFVHTLLVQSEALGGEKTRAQSVPDWVKRELARENRTRVSLDPYSFVLLRPCIFEVEDQDTVRDDIIRKQSVLRRPLPDLWRDNYRSVRNYLTALHSISRLATIITTRERAVDARFDLVLVARADTRLLCDTELPLRMLAILVAERKRMLAAKRTHSAGIVAVPPWGGWGGINDRFAFGARDPMLGLYCRREQWAWERFQAGTHPRNGETLLDGVLREYRVDVKHSSMVVQRFRTTGPAAGDVLAMRDDYIEFLRDELTQIIEPTSRHWVGTAGTRERGTTAEMVCAMARQAVDVRGTWGSGAGRVAQRPLGGGADRSKEDASLSSFLN